MKLVILLMLMLPLTACHISRSFQPPPQGYEIYYKRKHHDTASEIVKRDMLTCGFPSIYNNAALSNNEPDKYVRATLCMENKGYTTNSYGGICNIHSFENTEACQKYLNQK